MKVLIAWLTLQSVAADPTPARFEFTRMLAHWSEYGDPEYLSFVEEARPDLVQLGFYGAHFWSLAHTEQFGGYPMNLPVRGFEACGKWFEDKNAALHRQGVKVVGHFNMTFLVGDPDGAEGPRGFFKFYRDLWNERELGPKPAVDAIDFLEKDAQGKPYPQKNYLIGGMAEYSACLRNPNWRAVLKAWVKRGIERGVDGFIANYFYRNNCLCDHCQAGFRSYLKLRFQGIELSERFGIKDPDRHVFTELVCWHDPAQSTPLRREMLRWSQLSNKEAFDDVFHTYGRSLKPDLITAQWNHLGDFSQIAGDERCLLPRDAWGRGEDYLWYSAGGSACYTDLKNRFLGDVTLQARYIRGAFDDKPFTIGKYESTRTRSAIAELAANGGAPMGFYTRFTDPLARAEIARYYRFLKRYDELYRGSQSHAEVLLLYPRKAVHEGKVDAVEAFRQQGRKLLESHVLFDVRPDDLGVPPDAAYRHVVADSTWTTPDPFLSRFIAPFTVRVSASRPVHGNEIDLHFVNYDRTEPPVDAQGKPSPGKGIIEEQPKPARGVRADIALPTGFAVKTVEVMTPEMPEPATLKAHVSNGRVSFDVPEFFVYCVVRLRGQ